MVTIRFARGGTKKAPFYRIVVTNKEAPRDGKFLENIGTYDPLRKDGILKIDEARLQHWQSVGAIPSATVTGVIKRAKKAAAAAPAKK